MYKWGQSILEGVKICLHNSYKSIVLKTVMKTRCTIWKPNPTHLEVIITEISSLQNLVVVTQLAKHTMLLNYRLITVIGSLD